MTKVDQEIKKMMLSYPTLFPTRLDCWIHLFSTSGSGYHWNLETGELEYFQKENFPKKPKLSKIKETYNEGMKFYVGQQNVNIQYLWDNIDVAMEDSLFLLHRKNIFDIFTMNGWKNPRGKYFYPGTMQLACIHKDKISEHWRYEIAKYCRWVIREVHSHFNDSSPNNKILTDKEILQFLSKAGYRKALELKKTFYTALKVLNNIFTKEEKKFQNKMQKEMLKMVEQVVKNTQKRLENEKLVI